MEGDWMERMLKDRYDDLMARRAKIHSAAARARPPRTSPKSWST